MLKEINTFNYILKFLGTNTNRVYLDSYGYMYNTFECLEKVKRLTKLSF